MTILSKGGESVPIQIRAIRDEQWRNVKAFGGLSGSTAIAAEDATAKFPAGKTRWERIPDYGRGDSGVTIFPVTTPSVLPPGKAPIWNTLCSFCTKERSAHRAVPEYPAGPRRAHRRFLQ